jgi:hypothetical protein
MVVSAQQNSGRADKNAEAEKAVLARMAEIQ